MSPNSLLFDKYTNSWVNKEPWHKEKNKEGVFSFFYEMPIAWKKIK